MKKFFSILLLLLSCSLSYAAEHQLTASENNERLEQDRAFSAYLKDDSDEVLKSGIEVYKNHILSSLIRNIQVTPTGTVGLFLNPSHLFQESKNFLEAKDIGDNEVLKEGMFDVIGIEGSQNLYQATGVLCSLTIVHTVLKSRLPEINNHWFRIRQKEEQWEGENGQLFHGHLWGETYRYVCDLLDTEKEGEVYQETKHFLELGKQMLRKEIKITEFNPEHYDKTQAASKKRGQAYFDGLSEEDKEFYRATLCNNNDTAAHY